LRPEWEAPSTHHNCLLIQQLPIIAAAPKSDLA